MTAVVDQLPASYAAVHRYNGAVVQHDAREQIVPMAIQPRDFAIVLDVWRYKFLTAPMVHELHWAGGSLWPAQRRLQKMFNAGLLERFRPVSLRGSYPWTYHLGERGHVILRDSQVVDTGWRYRPHVVHEFGHVLHDLQLNAWVIAYRVGSRASDSSPGRARGRSSRRRRPGTSVRSRDGSRAATTPSSCGGGT